MSSLRQGDVLEVLQSLESESVDMVFADPPFNVGIKYAGKASNDDRADYPEWCASWISECFRVLKSTGTFYLMTITRHLEHLYPSMKAHGVFINQVNWKNTAAVNDKRSYWGAYQPILVYGKTDEYKFNLHVQRQKPQWQSFHGKTGERGQMSDWWDDITFVYAGAINHPEAILKSGTNSKAHPAQMPTDLPARAILFSTDEGDVVLDPFSGSGTTWEAAEKLGRVFIGIEREAEYVSMANQRLAKARLSPSFFHAFQQSVQRTGGESGQQSLFSAGDVLPAKVTRQSTRR